MREPRRFFSHNLDPRCNELRVFPSRGCRLPLIEDHPNCHPASVRFDPRGL